MKWQGKGKDTVAKEVDNENRRREERRREEVKKWKEEENYKKCVLNDYFQSFLISILSNKHVQPIYYNFHLIFLFCILLFCLVLSFPALSCSLSFDDSKLLSRFFYPS